MSRIIYEELEPDELLKDFVKRFWKIDNQSEYDKHSTILPDGYFDLILKTSDRKLYTLVLTGLYTKEVEVIIPGNSSFFGISFQPLASEYLFYRTIADILDSRVILDAEFWNIDKMPINSLREWKIYASEIMAVKVTSKTVDSRKQKLFNLLFQAKGSLTVQEISNHLFWNSRQINRYFKSNFGLSLKSYANILRCKASFKHLSKGSLYPQNNFADQAHFIHQIKKHTGSTPKVLAKNVNDRFIQFSTRVG